MRQKPENSAIERRDAMQPPQILPAPFDTVADAYDASFTDAPIGRRKRAAVHRHLRSVLRSDWRALELNCGTGEDAVWLANAGLHVLATDISERMLTVTDRKIHENGCRSHVATRILAIEQLARPELRSELGRFDLILSNFDGLNCVESIEWLPAAIDELLVEGGHAVFVFMPPWCVVESVHRIVHRRTKTSLRRRSGPVPIGPDRTGMTYFRPVSELVRLFETHLKVVAVRAIGLWTPPTFMASFHDRHIRTFERLAWLEDRCAAIPVLRTVGDHVLIHLQSRTDRLRRSP